LFVGGRGAEMIGSSPSAYVPIKRKKEYTKERFKGTLDRY
jgi:hypothetical protein